jgi:TPP-dependent 2-oxoacid decarboxylase
MSKAFITSVLIFLTTTARAADPLDRTIGPVQGRQGPPYIEFSVDADIKYFQQDKIEIFHKMTEVLAEKSEMNVRVVKMKISAEMCKIAKTKQPSMRAVARLFKDADRIKFAVKKNGDVVISGSQVPQKKP